MTRLQQADPERVVQFLHILLNNLCSLLVRPCVTGESGEGGREGGQGRMRGWKEERKKWREVIHIVYMYEV